MAIPGTFNICNSYYQNFAIFLKYHLRFVSDKQSMELVFIDRLKRRFNSIAVHDYWPIT